MISLIRTETKLTPADNTVVKECFEMRKHSERIIAAFLCILMLFGSAPLNGLAEAEFPDSGIISEAACRISELLDRFQVRLSASALGNSVIGGTCGRSLTWTYYDDGTLVIDGTGDMYGTYSYPDYAPWHLYSDSLNNVIIGDGVTGIGAYAFACCNAITSFTMGRGIKTIGSHAFYKCPNLSSVTFTDSVLSIGEYAFSECNSLKSITLSDSIGIVGDNAFWSCTGLTDVTLGNGVTEIGELAFGSCSSLKRIELGSSMERLGNDLFYDCISLPAITIPDGVTYIGNNAFNGCRSLQTITIPDSVTTIGGYAFSRCSGLESVSLGNGISKIDDGVFYGCSGLSGITIPAGVTFIGYNAFSWCRGLKNITIPGNVTSIGNFAFSYCTGLTSFTLPVGVSELGVNILCGCSGISSIAVEAGNGYYDSRSNCNAIIETGTRTLLSGCKNTEIPGGISIIADYAFCECNTLTEISVPNWVTSIGDRAFYYCTGLKSVVLGSGVSDIGIMAFSNCTSLKSINLPENLFYIDSSAFEYCTGLMSITIPDSVKAIENNAFNGVNNVIYSRNMKASGSPWGAKCVNGYTEDGLVFSNSSKTQLVACSADTEGSISIPDSVESIGRSAFNGCSRLTEIIIPGSVTTIGSLAFANCCSLKSITIPDSVTDIGYAAFANCYLLTDATLSDSISIIGDYAFYYCLSLRSINIPSGVTGIGGNAFAYCQNLRSINLPHSLTAIGSGAFSFSGALDIYYDGTVAEWDSIRPAGDNSLFWGLLICNNETVTDGHNLGSYLCFTRYIFDEFDVEDAELIYENNYRVTGIEVPEENTLCCTVDGVLFSSDMKKLLLFPSGSHITDYVIPDTVEEIGDYAFFGCCGLKSITIPAGVRHIGKSAFEFCLGLETIYYNAVNADYSCSDGTGIVFAWCGHDKALIIGDSVESVPDGLFLYDDLTSLEIGKNCRNIGTEQFVYSSIGHITVDGDNPNYTSVNDVLYSKNMTVLIKYAAGREDEAFVIPDTVEKICPAAFINAVNLRELHIPSTVTGAAAGYSTDNILFGAEFGVDTDVGMYLSVCSDSADSYAAVLAEKNGYSFSVCEGHSDMKILLDGYDPDIWRSDFEIRGTVSGDPEKEYTLTVNSTEVEIVNGAFCIPGDSLPEGMGTLTLKLSDNEGGFTAKRVVYRKDVSAPEITMNDYSEDWRATVTLTGKVSDSYSGVSKVSFFVDSGTVGEAALEKGIFRIGNGLLPAGKRTVIITVTDNAGNSKEHTISYRKDSTGPVISGVEVTPTGWSSFADVTIHASDDESGLHWEAYSFDGGRTWQSSATKRYFADTETGYKLFVRDEVGNVSIYGESVSISNIDTDSPEISFDSFPEDSWQKEFTVTGSVSDSISGVDTVSYDGNYLTLTENRFSIESASLPEGAHDLTIEAADKAGNEEQSSISYMLDRSVPSISFGGSYTDWSKTVKITGTTADAYSGVDSAQYSVDGGDRRTLRLNNGSFEIADSDLPSGTHTVTVYSTDRVGNTYSKGIVYSKDVTAPVISVSTDMADGVWKKSVTVSISASDTESGLPAAAYSFDGGKIWQSSSSKVYRADTVLDGVIMVRDSAGNISVYEDKIRIERIDSEGPVISAVIRSTDRITPNPVTVTVSASDTLSGVGGYSFDGGRTWQESNEKTYSVNTVISPGTIKVKDRVGNETSFSDTVKINSIYGYNIKVKVVDELGNAVPGATVYFNIDSDSKVTVTADSSGAATFWCPEQTCRIGAIKAGYTPNIIDVGISETRVAEVTIAISEQSLVDGNISAHRMTDEEKQKAGIDTENPDNSYVAKVDFSFVYDDIPYEGTGYVNNTHTVSGSGSQGSGGSSGSTGEYSILHMKPVSGQTGGSSGSGESHEPSVCVIVPKGNEECSILAILDLPVKASVLKEFFSVNIQLINNAPSVINVSDNVIKFSLPEGLSLVDGLEGCESSTEISFDSFAGQDTKSFTWVVRGDAPGSYNLSVDYGGSIDMFDTAFSARFETEKPLTVYGLEKVTLVAEPDTSVTAGSWHINFGIRNDSPVDISRPKIDPLSAMVTIIEKTEATAGAADVEIIGIRYENADGCVCCLDRAPGILGPGEAVYYECIAYGAVSIPEALFLKGVCVSALDGYGMNVSVNPVDMNHFDMTDYGERYSLLGLSNREAYEYLLNDGNYIYTRMDLSQASVTELSAEKQEQLIYTLVYSMLTSSEFNENVRADQMLKTAESLKAFLSLYLSGKGDGLKAFTDSLLSDTGRINALAGAYLDSGSEKTAELLGNYLSDAGLSPEMSGFASELDSFMLGNMKNLSGGFASFTECFGNGSCEAAEPAYMVFSTVTVMQACYDEAMLLLDTVIASVRSGQTPAGNAVLLTCEKIKDEINEGMTDYSLELTGRYGDRISSGSPGSLAADFVREAVGNRFDITGIAGESAAGLDTVFAISDMLLSQDGTDICTVISDALISGIDSMQGEEEITYSGKTLTDGDRSFYTMMLVRFLVTCRWTGEQYAGRLNDYIGETGTAKEEFRNSIAFTLAAGNRIFRSASPAADREPAPELTINYNTCKTDQSFSSSYEYCFGDGVWNKCSDSPIDITIRTYRQILRVRKAETEAALSGEEASVTVYSRNAVSRSIAVNYADGNYILTNLRNDLSYEMVPVADSSTDTGSISWQNALKVSAADKQAVVPSGSSKAYVAVRSARNDAEYMLESEPVVIKVSDGYISPETPHTHISKAVRIPETCLEQGSEYEICRLCGEIISEVTVITASGHDWDRGTVITEATCTVNGVIRYTCRREGCNAFKEEPITAKGHDGGKWTTIREATCSQEGMRELRCNKCGELLDKETLEKLSHTPGSWQTVTEATTEHAGRKELRCTKCSALIDEKEIPRLIQLDNANTGISVILYNGGYDNAELNAERVSDTSICRIVDDKTKSSQSFVYNIVLKSDGKEIQPEEKVTVRIPVPQKANSAYCSVVRINPGTQSIERIETEKEGNCFVFDTAKLGYYSVVEELPNARAKVSVAEGTTLDYRTKVTIVATATGVDEGYHLELTVNGKTYTGGRTRVESEEFELMSNTDYVVKVVDDKTLAEQSGLTEQGGTIICQTGFFKWLKAFFLGLLRLLPKETVKPK